MRQLLSNTQESVYIFNGGHAITESNLSLELVRELLTNIDNQFVILIKSDGRIFEATIKEIEARLILKDFFNSIDVQVDIIGDNESPNFETILKYICKSVNFYGYWNTETGIKQFSVTPIFVDTQDPEWEDARGYWLWSFPTYEEGKKFADMFGVRLRTLHKEPTCITS